jgi:hypothetical protein
LESELGPQDGWFAIEYAGDACALAGMWDAAGEPAPDGSHVDLDLVGELFLGDAGLVERVAEGFVAHLTDQSGPRATVWVRQKWSVGREMSEMSADTSRGVRECP